MVSLGKRIKKTTKLGKRAAKKTALGYGKGSIAGSKVVGAAGTAAQIIGAATGREDISQGGKKAVKASRAQRSTGRASLNLARGNKDKARSQIEKAANQTKNMSSNFA